MIDNGEWDKQIKVCGPSRKEQQETTKTMLSDQMRTENVEEQSKLGNPR